MTNMSNKKVEKTRTTFMMKYSVSINIKASPDKIWRLLTKANEFPNWNSTVSSIEGKIALGEQLKIKVPVAPDRLFKVKVSEFIPNKSMVWRDGTAPMFQGIRTYVLTPNSDGTTHFSMRETFRGLMLPMIAGYLPDFAPIFETYAADLQKAAE